MKREFLQNFKVGEQPLPKEIIDAIMAENGRDVEAAKAPFADNDHIKTQLAEAQTTLQGIQQKDTDLAAAQQKAQEWEQKYNQAVADHQAELADRDFQRVLSEAITGAKGRNAKAITALLDVDALRNSKNQESDIQSALAQLQKDSGYLFDDEPAPPPYASGTGAPGGGTPHTSGTLADALRERYERK